MALSVYPESARRQVELSYANEIAAAAAAAAAATRCCLAGLKRSDRELAREDA